MSDEAFKKRLAQARISAGFGKKLDAAAALGISKTAYYGYEDLSSPKRPSVDVLERIARKFNVSLDWLLSAKGESQMPPKGEGVEVASTTGIAIYGKVEAGRFIEVDDAFDPHYAEVTEAPKHHRFPNARHMAFEVQGDSMTLAGIMPGDFVIAVAWEDTGYFPLTGMIVVVEQTRNGGHMIERTIKEIEVRRDGVALLPRSSNHIHKPIFLPKDHDDDGKTARIVGLVYHVSRPLDLRF